ncbi:two-component system sensor histidine kinase NtrB [Pseudodesulfovibrio sp.]|uniref:two-component system sensor histidine kinase NtrB n=1 Tax=unclassified Pseudodesulfovibrio TaxID=2661612 RepID=UPI003AFF6ED4
MDVHAYSREKGPLVALVLALIVLGLGSLYLTWRSIAHQREIVEDHMILTGSSILRGVENNLSRFRRTVRLSPQAAPLFPAMAQELFVELTKSEDIQFITLLGGDGHPLVTSEEDKRMPTLDLPETVTRDIEPGRAWHVMAQFGKRAVLISGLMTDSALSALTRGQPPRGGMGQGMGPGMGQGLGPDGEHGMGHGMGRGRHMGEPPVDVEPVYLVVGLNAEKHLAQFRQYRRAALYQTGYVFLAAVVLWSLAFGYLRRRSEGRRLVRMERFQSKLLDNMPDGLVTLSDSGEILAANKSAKELLAPQGEEEPPEIIGNNWSSFAFSLKPGRSPHAWEQFDYQGRQLEILALPLQGNGEDAVPDPSRFLVLIRDRTEIRSLEEDLNEAKRLAAIGSLAAGVAHEVRNPLSSLRGFAQLFANKLKGQAPLDRYATTMVQEADRLNRVVTDLLYLARPRQLDPKDVNLAELGESLLQLMRFDFEDKKTLPELAFGGLSAHADPDALRQVLLNLISNSLDALAGCSDCPKPGHIRLTAEAAHDGTWIVVGDDGPGMNPEIRENAFKPFVTGKKTGTGLGLAIVHNIMRAHRGRVVIDSEPGEGTRVRLFFPDKENEDA